MIYSIPYIILIAIYAGLAWAYHSVDEEWKKRISIISVAIYVLFFGFRGYIGDDWTSYYPAFEKLTFDNLQSAFYSFDDSIFEPGFTLLMLGCKSLYDSYQFFIFICCLINSVLLFRFLFKNVDNIPLALIFFLCMGGFIMQMNQLRNSIAILLVLNALEFIKQKKPIPYFSICLLALMFHSTSILYFPLYFFFNRKCPKLAFLIFFIFGNLAFLIHVKFLSIVITTFGGGLGEVYNKMMDAYMDLYGDKSGGLSIGYLERLLTGILIYCYYEKLLKIREDNIMYINAFIAYFTMFFLLSEIEVVSMRMSNLFAFCYWILWGDIIKCFTIPNNRKLFIIFLVIYCTAKMIGMTKFITTQYDNVLFGAKSYEERLYIYDKNVDKVK